MNEFYNPNQNGEDPIGFGDSARAADSVTFDEPAPELNIVVDDGGYCRKCGSRLEAGDIFCSKCGARADGSTAAQAQRSTQTRYAQSAQYTNSYPSRDIRQEQHAQHAQHAQQAQPNVINNYYYNTNNSVNTNTNMRVHNTNKKLKDKRIALILCVLFGWCGAHRYYEGKIASGIIWTLTGGLGGVGWLVDLLILVFKSPYYEP